MSDDSHRLRLVGAGSRLFGTPLRGREDLQSLISDGAAAGDAGDSVILVFRGVPGVGKTRLLAEVLRETERRGWAALTITADPDSNLIPLAALLDAVSASDPPLLPRAELDALAADPDTRYWLVQVLHEALEAATVERGFTVVIDDLQWFDAGSLAVLRSLVRRVADLPILWAISVRPGEHSPQVAAALAGLPSTARMLDVGPLRDEAVADIVADIVGAEPDPALSAVVRHADNVPLLVVELVHGLLEEELVSVRRGEATVVGESVVPERFGASIRERLAHLSPGTRSFLQVAAVLGHGFTLRSAAELLGRSTAELVDPVNEALAAHMIVDEPHLAFRHQAISDAALRMLPKPVRTQLARDAARARIAAGEPVLAVAGSIADTARPGEADSIEWLHDAALQLAPSDAQSAAALAARTAELAGATPRFAPLLAELVPVLWAGGRADAATSLGDRLRGLLPAAGEALVQLSIARLQTESSFADALSTCERALALDGLSDEVRAQLLAVKALNCANIGAFEELAETLADARAAALRSQQHLALATIEATESVLRFHQNDFTEAGRLIESAEQRIARSTGLVPSQWLPEGLWNAFLANSLGDGERALALADANLAESLRRRNAPAAAFWMMLRARVLFDLGRLDDAKTQAESVLTFAEELQLGDFTDATAGHVLFRVAVYQGDRAEVARASAAVIRMAESPSLRRAGRWLLALAADDVGDAPAALAYADAALESLADPVASMTTPPDFGDDVDLLRIVLRGSSAEQRACGGGAHVAAVLASTATRAAGAPQNPLAVGIDRHARGIAEGSVGELRGAVELLRRATRPLVLACALEDLGLAQAESDPSGAAAAWEEALEIFEVCGAVRDAGRMRRLLRTVGVTRRPKTQTTPHGLTTRELQVVARLAEGATTKQIASDLYLSPHTVITHIRHASHKWGVSTRRALVAHYVSLSEQLSTVRETSTSS